MQHKRVRNIIEALPSLLTVLCEIFSITVVSTAALDDLSKSLARIIAPIVVIRCRDEMQASSSS